MDGTKFYRIVNVHWPDEDDQPEPPPGPSDLFLETFAKVEWFLGGTMSAITPTPGHEQALSRVGAGGATVGTWHGIGDSYFSDVWNVISDERPYTIDVTINNLSLTNIRAFNVFGQLMDGPASIDWSGLTFISGGTAWVPIQLDSLRYAFELEGVNSHRAYYRVLLRAIP